MILKISQLTFAQAVPVEESDDDDDELPPLISSLVEVASDGIVPIIFKEKPLQTENKEREAWNSVK